MQAKVYIILVNYNGWKDTIECIESIYQLDYTNYEIVLIDNCSTNKSVEKLLDWCSGKITTEIEGDYSKFITKPKRSKPLSINHIHESDDGLNQTVSKPDLTLIKAKSNRGFSAGNNLGIQYALDKKNADYFWILNNDTFVDTNSLNELVKNYTLKKKDKIGILGGKIRYYDNPKMLQCAAGGTFNKWLAYSKQIGNQEIDEGQYDNQPLKLDLIIGACMFVDSEFIHKVGLLSEDYFLYYEEQDWAERAKKRNLTLSYAPEAIIYHKEGRSIGGTQLNLKGISKLSDFYYARNKIILTKKFYNPICLLTVYLSFFIIAINRIRRGQANRIPMLLSILINPSKKFED